MQSPLRSARSWRSRGLRGHSRHFDGWHSYRPGIASGHAPPLLPDLPDLRASWCRRGVNPYNNTQTAGEVVDKDIPWADPSRCALCGTQTKLCDSHIIPEMCYKPCYETIGTERKAILISGDAAVIKKPFIRKGVYCKLLCRSCEELINREYEMPFSDTWMSGRCIPQPFPSGPFVISCGEYRKFQLFHNSVLWRAGVAAMRFGRQFAWPQVYLAPKHEKRLRAMVFSGDLGNVTEYPVSGFFIVNPENPTKWMPEIIQEPIPKRIWGMNGFSTIFGGVNWIYWCSGHINPAVQRIALQPDGTLMTHSASIFENEELMHTHEEDFRRTGGHRR